ncbi:hypothetical protein [Marinimicrobium sp. ARAG 43.8]|uniref:hypothetical protein n=1 Tax=Marinimicrobium sp. ARAG 43.8 TaxID=3418719 RepID=UPI003CEF9605
MTKQRVTIVLITLMVLQTFMVAADAHPFSQWTDRPLEWSLEAQDLGPHAGNGEIDSRDAANTALLTDDCSCCSQCHACWLAVFAHQFSDFYPDATRKLPFYHISLSSDHASSLFRPPKA